MVSLRSFPRKEREEYLNEFMEELLNGPDSFVLDSHYSIMVNENVMNSMNDWAKNIHTFVLLTAPVKTLMNRISSDSGRDRALFPEGLSEEDKIQLLDKFQRHLICQSEELAKVLNKPFLRLENINLDQSVKEFTQFVESVKF